MGVEQDPPEISYGLKYPRRFMINGMIIMWSKPLADIPNGWAVCDGTNGTPDLRDKFIKGAAPDADPGAEGGAVEHNHDFTGNGHNHSVDLTTPGTMQVIETGVMMFAKRDSTIDAAAGTTDKADGQPPFYSLIYIMKL